MGRRGTNSRFASSLNLLLACGDRADDAEIQLFYLLLLKRQALKASEFLFIVIFRFCEPLLKR